MPENDRQSLYRNALRCAEVLHSTPLPFAHHTWGSRKAPSKSSNTSPDMPDSKRRRSVFRVGLACYLIPLCFLTTGPLTRPTLQDPVKTTSQCRSLLWSKLLARLRRKTRGISGRPTYPLARTSRSPRAHCPPNKPGMLGCLARLPASRHFRCGSRKSSRILFKAFPPYEYLAMPRLVIYRSSFRELTGSLILHCGALYPDAQTLASPLLQAPCFLVGFFRSLTSFYPFWFLSSATMTAPYLYLSLSTSRQAHKRVFYSLCLGKYS
jgi:hypothetical protein